MVSAYSSYITGKPTEESIQAMTDVELQTILKTDLHRLAEGNIRWINFMRIMAERSYVEQEDRSLKDRKSDKFLDEVQLRQHGIKADHHQDGKNPVVIQPKKLHHDLPRAANAK